jgi:hypothetical protein
MNVLFDECVPRPLRRHLPGHDCKTVQEMGWRGISNGEMLRRAVGGKFDVPIVSDQNLKYQQNLKQFSIAIIVLPTNDIFEVLALADKVRLALERITPGAYVEIKS